jgi:hypothetical protein
MMALCRNKSTYGMAMSMVCMWTCGDIFKTSYFYLRQTPPQFFICGSLQVVGEGKAKQIYVSFLCFYISANFVVKNLNLNSIRQKGGFGKKN